MSISRRDFLKSTAAIAGASIISGTTHAHARDDTGNYKDRNGVLVDTTFCNGCRRCEWACNDRNKNPNKPLKDFEDKSVFEKMRRPAADTFTVVNRFSGSEESRPVYVKRQCMHCKEPACLSACFVDAFKKTPKGAVIYNPALCIGCRYCMIACPFEIPAYEYNEPINPRVRKCTFCFDRLSEEGGIPACVEICTAEALRFGKRDDLIKLAHERIVKNPNRYVDHVYGEHEVGGTSWLYLSSVPFAEIGFRPDLSNKPIPDLSKGFLLNVKILEVAAAWPLVFAAFYAISKMRDRGKNSKTSPEKNGGAHGKKT